MRTLDFSPLSAAVSRDEVKAWRAEVRSRGIAGATLGTVLKAIVAFGVFVPIALVVVFIVSIVGFDFFGTAFGEGNPIAIGFVVFFVLALALVGFAIIRQVVGGGLRTWETSLRTERFARANGMTFEPVSADPVYPGMIFQSGHSRAALDHLTSADGRFFDLGNYRYKTGSGDDERTHTWGFLAFHLDRRLPNMVLDSTSNNSVFGSNLPATFTRDQVLSLEGDFDRYFTLYCPRQYERDALYVFTPDLMALLIDEAAPYDVEIVDDWMFVYSSAPFVTGHADTYSRLFRIMDTVGAKALTQTDRYVDERVGDYAANVVAPQGTRLKRGVSVFSVLVVIAVVAFWVWNLIDDATGGLTP